MSDTERQAMIEALRKLPVKPKIAQPPQTQQPLPAGTLGQVRG